MNDGEPGTWDFRVRATHFSEADAERMVEGNALDDPFGKVTVEETLGGVPVEERGNGDGSEVVADSPLTDGDAAALIESVLDSAAPGMTEEECDRLGRVASHLRGKEGEA